MQRYCAPFAAWLCDRLQIVNLSRSFLPSRTLDNQAFIGLNATLITSSLCVLFYQYRPATKLVELRLVKPIGRYDKVGAFPSIGVLEAGCAVATSSVSWALNLHLQMIGYYLLLSKKARMRHYLALCDSRLFHFQSGNLVRSSIFL